MKPLEDMTYDELAQYNQAKILLSIPIGQFNNAVWVAMDLTLRWKSLQKEKKQNEPQ